MVTKWSREYMLWLSGRCIQSILPARRSSHLADIRQTAFWWGFLSSVGGVIDFAYPLISDKLGAIEVGHIDSPRPVLYNVYISPAKTFLELEHSLSDILVSCY
jgi:hypothetical protein